MTNFKMGITKECEYAGYHILGREDRCFGDV